jgi:hypothetical protein
MTAGEPFCLKCGNVRCTCQNIFLGGYDMPNVSGRITINGKSSESNDMDMIFNKLSNIEQLLRIISSHLYIRDCNRKGGDS